MISSGSYIYIQQFTINGVEYFADENMLWSEWIQSDYNLDAKYEINSCGYIGYKSYWLYDSNSNSVAPSMKIIAESNYTYDTRAGEIC